MEALGINLAMIIIYTVLFGVLYVVLNKFFLKKIFVVIEKRQEDINQGYKDAEQAKDKLEKIDEEYKEMISKAKSEVKLIKEEAAKESEVEKKQVLEEAKTEAVRIVEKANKKFEEYKNEYESKIDEQVAVKAKEVLHNLIGENKDIEKSIIEGFINKL